MFSLEHTCPKCSASFVPWRVWAISRWSCIQCPACEAKLNRRIDLRAVLIYVVTSMLVPGVVIFSYALSVPWSVIALLVFTSFVLFWLIDVLTVRLVVAGEKRGIFGYKE